MKRKKFCLPFHLFIRLPSFSSPSFFFFSTLPVYAINYDKLFVCGISLGGCRFSSQSHMLHIIIHWQSETGEVRTRAELSWRSPGNSRNGQLSGFVLPAYTVQGMPHTPGPDQPAWHMDTICVHKIFCKRMR